MPPIKQILTKVSSLNGAQRRLGHYLQNDSTALLDANVNELAKAVGVSNATVVRFAKSLGYKGFPNLSGIFSARCGVSCAPRTAWKKRLRNSGVKKIFWLN